MKLKYGMVGGGSGAFIGAVHRKAIALDSTAELVAGALSSTPERALISGKELGLQRNYPTWQAMLEGELQLPEAERINFVVIVTPNHMHYPVAKAFAQAGIHVVCDKPLVHHSHQAQDLMATVQVSGVVFAVTYNYTGYPLVRQARHMVQSGGLGAVRKVLVEYHQGWLANKLEDSGQKQATWRADPSQSGLAGAMGDIGSHAENLLNYITQLDISYVCADLSSFVPGRALDDDASMLLRLSNGAKGILSASQIAVGHENALRIRVFGEKGSLEWFQENPNELKFYSDGALQIYTRAASQLCPEAQAACRLPTGHPEGFIEAFANIYRGVAERMITGSGGIFPTLQDGARGVHFIEKVLESSSSTHKWTAL